MKNRSYRRRTVNTKAVLVLTGCCLALVIAVHFVHGLQIKRHAQALLAQAEQAEQEGQPRQAIDHLELYLGIVPNDTEALARYGTLLHKLATKKPEFLRAYLVLEQALHRDEQRADVRRQVAELALKGGRFADAKKNLEILLQQAGWKDAELLELLAKCELSSGQFETALERFAQAFELAPGRMEVALQYAKLLRERVHRPKEADGVIERMIQADERSAAARLNAAMYFKQIGAWDKAEKQLQFALEELHSHDAEVLLFAAELARVRGRIEQATSYLQQGLKRYPHDARMRLELARLETQSGKPQQALTYLEPLLKTLPKQADELWRLANRLLDLDKWDLAGGISKRLGDSGATEAADYLQARLLLHQGAWGEARTLLEKTRVSRSAQSPAVAKHVNCLLGECYAHLGNPDQQMRAYRRALECDPQWLPARQGLASALAALGQTDEAIAVYRRIVGQAPELGIELARLLLERNYRLAPEDQNWGEVEQVLKELPQGMQHAVEVQILRADLLVARKQPEEARKLMERERERDPQQIQPWLFLAELANWQGQREAILPLLDEAERRVGNRVEWELERARYWVQSGSTDAAKELGHLAERLPQFPDADQDRLLLGLGAAFVTLRDFSAAERLWLRVAGRQPKDLNVRFLLFELAVDLDHEAEARRLLAEIKQIEGPGGALAAYSEAAYGVLLARRGDPSALSGARARLAEAAALRPSWSLLDLLSAQIDDLEGNKEKALEKYQAVLARGDNRLSLVRRVVELLYEQGRYAEANALLHKQPQEVFLSRGLGRLAAELALLDQGGEALGGARSPDRSPTRAAKQRAFQIARQMVPESSKNCRDYLWLGQLASLAGQPEEAEKALRHARQLAETVPDTWLALVSFLARTDIKKAEAVVEEAKHKLAKDEAPLVLALCCEALGRLPQAEEYYRAALAAKPDDVRVLRSSACFYAAIGQPAKAETVLRKLLDPNTAAPESTRGWARRHLALALAVQGSYPQFREALALLEEPPVAAWSPDHATTEANRRTKALVLATRSTHRREAIALFETLSPLKTSTPPDIKFLLAKLYEAEGKWPKARALLLALLSAQENHPVYLAHYARGLLREGQVAEAQEYVDRLSQVDPQNFETIELRARVLHANGKAQEAVSLLKAYATEPETPARDNGSRARRRPDLAARTLEQLGHLTEAEELYRKGLATSQCPESALLLAQNLARQKRLPEALALCEQAGQSCSPEAVAAALVIVLRLGQAGPEEQRRVEQWLTAAIEKHPQTLGLSECLAGLYMSQGRYAEALALYHALVRQAPHEVPVLNNLAYLLALNEGNLAEGLERTETALGIAGPLPSLLDTRALIYLRSKQPARAVEDLQQAVRQTPSPVYYFHLAQALHSDGNRLAAAQAFRKATVSGLTAKDLLSLERPAFERLAAELNQ